MHFGVGRQQENENDDDTQFVKSTNKVHLTILTKVKFIIHRHGTQR